MSKKGFYRPKNPEKYKGDPTTIIYRSSWELKLMVYLDKSKEVVLWSSEELKIPYRSPMDNKIHSYYPDFFVRKKTSAGVIEDFIIEVKPKKQVNPPIIKKVPDMRYLKEVRIYGINTAKWKAAREYCKNKNWKFVIYTEKELGL